MFLGEYINKVDKKGRVSVPAPFRAALGEALSQGVSALPPMDPRAPAIEVWPAARIARLYATVDGGRKTLKRAQIDGAMRMFAKIRQLRFDDTGRTQLPEELRRAAGIDGEAVFVGRGGTFQVWAPDRYQADDARLEQSAPDEGLMEMMHDLAGAAQ